MRPEPGAVPDERMLDTSIAATEFIGPEVASAPPIRARVVVVGGGLLGASTALHLALAGERDVLLLERNRIASGTSWHAAGLLARVRGSHALTELASYGVDLYAGLEAKTGLPVAFNQNGSLTLARQPGRVDELRSTAAMARHHGVDAELVDPRALSDLHPLLSADGVLTALHQPGDAMINPGWGAAALARRAHDLGVTVREDVAVTGLRVEGPADDRRVTGVVTEAGVIEAERVVLCCGVWTRDLAASVGAAVALYAAEHVHVTTTPVAGAVASMPLVRDLDSSLYIRHHRGALVVGAFEPDGKPRSMSGIGSDFAFSEFEPDWEHFRPIRANAERAVPALRTVTYQRFLCAPESFTPDVNFCLGETPEVAGLFVGAGFNSQGVIYAPGAGQVLADWVLGGAPGFDSSAVDVGRFAAAQANRRYLHRRTTESLGRLYAMHWPQLQSTAARGVRRTPLTERLHAAGGRLGETNGWERPLWFGRPGDLAEPRYSYGRQEWFDATASEHRAAREAVAFFDLSSFSKFEVTGPNACAVLQRVLTADVDIAIGRVVYTLALNLRGGIVLDGTVLRLGAQRFLVVTPTTAHRATMHLLRRAASGAACEVFDATSGTAVLHLAGPASRELVSRLLPYDADLSGLPRFGVRPAEIADADGLVARVSFTGELGYELYVPTDYAVGVFDAVLEAGADLGLRLAGLHALDSLRLEVGYRHLGHDITPAENPWAAGLDRFVAAGKSFVGQEAVEANPAVRQRRQAFLLLDDPDAVLHGGDSVRAGGRVVGEVTSAAPGHTLGADCGIVMLEPGFAAALTTDGTAEVDVDVDVLFGSGGGKVRWSPFRTPSG